MELDSDVAVDALEEQVQHSHRLSLFVFDVD